MDSSLSVVLLGLLKMRDFQHWLAMRHLCPRRHLSHRVRISTECVMALNQWRNPCVFRTAGGGMSLRKVVTTDTSLTGWGAVFQSILANGHWTPQLRKLHVNMLELMAVFLALNHCLPFLERFHVLVRTDNMMMYINRQGGSRSLQLHSLARKLIVWSTVHFSSLCVIHILGVLKVGADFLSGGNLLYGEWVLHPQGRCRSLRLVGKCKMSAIFLSLERKCAVGCGCVICLYHLWSLYHLLTDMPLYACITSGECSY